MADLAGQPIEARMSPRARHQMHELESSMRAPRAPPTPHREQQISMFKSRRVCPSVERPFDR
jgi:hypothetical protein